MSRPVEAHMVKIDAADRNVSRAGAFYFVRRPGVPGVAGIIHGCPCGCGARNLVYLRGGGNGRPEWSVVAGKWPGVTLSPLISLQYDVNGKPGEGGAPHWQGRLIEGVFVEEVTPTESRCEHVHDQGTAGGLEPAGAGAAGA